MTTKSISDCSTNTDYLVYTLERYVEDAEKSNAELAADIIKYGICDRLGWLREPMMNDALGQVSKKILNTIEAGESLQTIHDNLEERIGKELGYICIGNSDNDAKILTLQAMQRVLQSVKSTINRDNK